MQFCEVNDATNDVGKMNERKFYPVTGTTIHSVSNQNHLLQYSVRRNVYRQILQIRQSRNRAALPVQQFKLHLVFQSFKGLMPHMFFHSSLEIFNFSIRFSPVR